MTRSVTITNTSNWADEPILAAGTILAPGESITLDLDIPDPSSWPQHDEAKTLKVMALRTPRMPVPFAEADPPHHQLLPEVRVDWVAINHEVKGDFATPEG